MYIMYIYVYETHKYFFRLLLYINIKSLKIFGFLKRFRYAEIVKSRTGTHSCLGIWTRIYSPE